MTEATSQNANVVVEALRAWSANAISEVVEFRGETTIVLARKVLRTVAERCRNEEKLQFNLLTDATCVDRFPMEPRFELNYHLLSLEYRKRIRLKVRIPGDDPQVQSVTPIWPAASWCSRW